MELKNKVVLITGGSRGIGKATAIALAKEGCSVIINFKSDIKAAQEVLADCNRYSKGNIAIGADVSKEKEVIKMFDEIKQKFLNLDMLVNNAGIFDDNDNPTNIEAFENIYRSNFLSCVITTKYAEPLMQAGKIINISSIHGRLKKKRFQRKRNN